MREYRNTSGSNDQFHSVERVGRVVRFKIAGAWMQNALERGAPIRHVPAGDERVGDVRSADGRADGGLLENIPPGDVVVESEAFDNALGSPQPRLADAGGFAHDAGIRGIEEVSEHVHAAPARPRRELHTGDHDEAGSGCCRSRFLPPGRRIVVGERNRSESRDHRRPHELCGRLSAVRHAAVRVEVDRRSHPVIVWLPAGRTWPEGPPGASELHSRARFEGFRTTVGACFAVSSLPSSWW